MEDFLNLHTIEMDDCVFKFDWHDKQEDMMDLKNRPGHHLFYKCCANFRRVSIRNMDMHIHTIEHVYYRGHVVSFNSGVEFCKTYNVSVVYSFLYKTCKCAGVLAFFTVFSLVLDCLCHFNGKLI